MKIEYYKKMFADFSSNANERWQSNLYDSLQSIFKNPGHGDFEKWEHAVAKIPSTPTYNYNLDDAIIQIGKEEELNEVQQQNLKLALQELIPWRKGPFNLFGIHIDAEWRSDQKWYRLQPHLCSLKNKRVLDVGCGNGYYMLRMLGSGAKQVIGVDPNLLFLAQFYALTKNISSLIDAFIIPLAFEELPRQLKNFDCVFSMGVLYHRRDPHAHLDLIFQHTAPGGMIYLETLVVDKSYCKELIPDNRYAGMRNVWNVPSPELIQTWLSECGFADCELLNVDPTTIDEQRSTEWMPYHSLKHHLDPTDPTKTIEGYPAPLRAIFCARKPPL